MLDVCQRNAPGLARDERPPDRQHMHVSCHPTFLLQGATLPSADACMRASSPADRLWCIFVQACLSLAAFSRACAWTSSGNGATRISLLAVGPALPGAAENTPSQLQ